MTVQLTKEAIEEIVLNVMRTNLPTLTSEMLGTPIEEVMQQVAMTSSIAHDAATAKLGAILGKSGTELVAAATQLSEYYATLTPEQQAQYADESKVIELYGQLNASAPQPAPADLPTSTEPGKVNEQGQPIFSREDLAAKLSADSADFFTNPDMQAAYLEGRVEA